MKIKDVANVYDLVYLDEGASFSNDIHLNILNKIIQHYFKKMIDIDWHSNY